MFPVIDVGPFAIQASGLILLLSFFFGSWLTTIFSKRMGTNEDIIENCLLLGLIIGIIGARIGFLLQNPFVVTSNPLSIVSLTPSMLNPGFGLLTGVIAAVIIAQRNKLPLWPTLDSITPFILMMYAGIHLANFANGNQYGLITNLPWGIELWGAVRHPVQLYALLLGLGILVWFLIQTNLLRSTGFLRSGILSCLVIILLGFSTLFSRAFVENKQLIGPWDTWQLIGLLTLIISLVIIFNRAFRSQGPVSILICIGSNTDPIKNIRFAQQHLAKAFEVIRYSAIYKSDPVKDGKEGTYYLNQVIEIQANHAYPDILEKMKSIEREFHRQPGNRKQITLDLDIITFNGHVFSYNGRQVPDPDLLKFRYIAIPLAEMAPGFRHPANGKAINLILKNITDDTRVTKLTEVEYGFEK